MRKITTGNYTIDIFEDHAYSPNESIYKYNNLYFDTANYAYASIISIKVYNADQLLKSAVAGVAGCGVGVHETSFVCEPDRIVACCADTVFCLSLPDLSLIWKTKADEATCFEIFKYKTDYIIHGELEISRLANNGEILWQRNGADIFTTIESNKDNFVIFNDHILATDWGNRKYKFDFDGNDFTF